MYADSSSPDNDIRAVANGKVAFRGNARVEHDPHVHHDMNTKTLKNATINVSLAHSRYGTPEPEIALRYPSGTHYRVVRAALYALASELESATSDRDKWVIEVDAFGDEMGRVFLDLIQGSEPEAERGLELLRKVVG